jgi:peptidoglycan/LPS O-acetylase OafA/YrhL
MDRFMFDYRNPDGPSRKNLRRVNAAWRWLAGAAILLVIVILASAFVSYEPIEAPCRSLCSMNSAEG